MGVPRIKKYLHQKLITNKKIFFFFLIHLSCDFDSVSWVDEREIIRKEERKKKTFLLIDRRSARSIFCMLLIADFSRSSSLEGVSSAKKIIEEKNPPAEREEKEFSFFVKN